MRWVAVGLLVPVAMLNYLDRQMMATMRGSMMDDLPDVLTRARWGLALAVFKWIYAALSPLAGILADSLDRRRLLAASLFVWSLTTWLTGQIESFRGLLATRAIMGVSEALYMPSALSLIADLHEQNTRSRAIGLHQSGIHIGVLLGGFTGYVCAHVCVACLNVQMSVLISQPDSWTGTWEIPTCLDGGGSSRCVARLGPCMQGLSSWPLETHFAPGPHLRQPQSPLARRSPCLARTTSSGEWSCISRYPPFPLGLCATGCQTFSAKSLSWIRARLECPLFSLCSWQPWLVWVLVGLALIGA
eukprot:m.183843 g.183843  ORF g.183843 m.183843 type:complete len:302 (-) comp53510_c0_seq1:1026-1931(-)